MNRGNHEVGTGQRRNFIRLFATLVALPVIFLLLISSLASAQPQLFHVDVYCPSPAVLPGDAVTCSLRLREPFNGVFGVQFEIIASEGISEGTPFVEGIAPIAARSGGLSSDAAQKNTLLISVTPVSLGTIDLARVHLRTAPVLSAGDYFVNVRSQRSGNSDFTMSADSLPGIIRVQEPGGRLPPPAPPTGDVTGDGQITMDDAIAVARHFLGIRGLSSAGVQNADTACPARTINLDDAIALARVALGILPPSALGCPSG